MDVLKKVLAVMLVILAILVGAGLYLSNTMKHGTMNMETPNTGQKGAAPTPETTKQNINVILQPDLRNYIDEINKGISLINEANGLVTSDSFFANPPKVPKGKVESTPFDKLIPKDRDRPILVMPDGTYQIIDNSGLDMRDIHRGIYKLGQGMTVLNSVLDRMNEDIKNNNFPFKQNATVGTTMPNMSGMNMPNTTTMNMPGTTGTMSTGTPNGNMPNMSMGGTGTSLLGSLSLTNIMYVFLVGFLILGIISIIGFVASLFRPKTANNPEND